MNPILPRNLGLDLVRATEAAAISAARWMGLNQPEEADHVAGDTMRRVLSTVEMAGTVIAGEAGRLASSTAFQTGERVGSGTGPRVDVVLDPIDGRGLLAREYPGAISVVTVAPQGALWAPPGAMYMDKLVVSAAAGPYLVPECLDAPAAWTLALVARAEGKRVGDLTVFVLDRPRHADLIQEIRRAGARIMLRSDGDIVGALMAGGDDSGVDILMGVGGVPEGLIAACSVKATGGAMLGRLAPQSATEEIAILEAGLDPKRILTTSDLVASDAVYFAATGITDGPLLSRVRFQGDRARSNSLILRGETHTRRFIAAEHLLDEHNHMLHIAGL